MSALLQTDSCYGCTGHPERGPCDPYLGPATLSPLFDSSWDIVPNTRWLPDVATEVFFAKEPTEEEREALSAIHDDVLLTLRKTQAGWWRATVNAPMTSRDGSVYKHCLPTGAAAVAGLLVRDRARHELFKIEDTDTRKATVREWFDAAERDMIEDEKFYVREDVNLLCTFGHGVGGRSATAVLSGQEGPGSEFCKLWGFRVVSARLEDVASVRWRAMGLTGPEVSDCPGLLLNDDLSSTKEGRFVFDLPVRFNLRRLDTPLSFEVGLSEDTVVEDVRLYALGMFCRTHATEADVDEADARKPMVKSAARGGGG